MEKNRHNDRLEEYFRKAFEEEQRLEPVQGWDVPPDHIWDAIQQVVVQPKPSTPLAPWKWVSAAAIIIGALIAFQWYTCTQVNALQEQLKENTVQLEKLQQQHSSTEREKINTNPANTNNEAAMLPQAMNQPKQESKNPLANEASELAAQKRSSESQQQFADSQKDTKQAVTSASKSTSIYTSSTANQKRKPLQADAYPKASSAEKEIATSAGSNKSDSPTNSINPSIDGIEKASENYLPERLDKTTVESATKESSQPLALLPSATFSILSPERTPDLNLLAPPSKTIKPQRKPATWYVGMTYAPTFVTKKLKSDRPGIMVITDRLKAQEKADYSFDVGLHLGYRFSSGWGVESGVIYSQANVGASEEKQLRYTRVGERPTGSGEFANDYPTTFTSSFGAVPTNITLNRSSGTSIQENTFINLQFDVRNQLEFIRIPLLLSYQSGQGRLSFTAKAGIAWSHLKSRTLEIKRARSLNNGTRVQEESRTIKDVFGKLNRNTIDLELGVGVAYALTKQWSILAEPHYSQSLTPILDHQHIRNYPQRIGLHLGVQYMF